MLRKKRLNPLPQLVALPPAARPSRPPWLGYVNATGSRRYSGLPDLALGAAQATDLESVDPDQLDVDVRLGVRSLGRLVGRSVTGDK
jgi:hypothetical protein